MFINFLLTLLIKCFLCGICFQWNSKPWFLGWDRMPIFKLQVYTRRVLKDLHISSYIFEADSKVWISTSPFRPHIFINYTEFSFIRGLFITLIFWGTIVRGKWFALPGRNQTCGLLVWYWMLYVYRFKQGVPLLLLMPFIRINFTFKNTEFFFFKICQTFTYNYKFLPN